VINAITPIHNFTYEGARLHIYHANKGEGLPKHEHLYSHATVCHSGSCVIRVQEKQVVMTKKTKPINLPAGKWHEIEALEDETVFVNVFAEGKN
jgi:quercetin dioxygenase-like cupin family protein